MTARQVSATLCGIALVLATFATIRGGSAFAQDGETASITVHLRLCEEVAPDGNYYPACHGNPYPGIEVFVAAGDVPEPALTTDAEGNATFSVVPGTWGLGGPGLGAQSGVAVEATQIVCSPDDDPASPVQYPLTLEAGDAITCDYYVVLAGDDGAVAETPAATGGEESTGSVAGDSSSTESDTETSESGPQGTIVVGTCDQPGDAVADLTGLAAPVGNLVGAEVAASVENSFTRLDISLDDILADDHAVVVVDAEDPDTTLACGAIGGVQDEDGSIAFGLYEAEEDSFVGIVYLAPDGDGTQLTVFFLQPDEAE